jgi:hypothetical protein
MNLEVITREELISFKQEVLELLLVNNGQRSNT